MDLNSDLDDKLKELENALKDGDGKINKENRIILDGIKKDIEDIKASLKKMEEMKKNIEDQ